MDKTLAIIYPKEPTISINSVTLVNNTAKEVLFTVPSGKTWFLHWLVLKNPDDVQRNCNISLYHEAAKTNLYGLLIDEAVVASAAAVWPRNFHADDQNCWWQMCAHALGFPLKAGGTVRFYYAAGGVSAGGTDADGNILCYTEL